MKLHLTLFKISMCCNNLKKIVTSPSEIKLLSSHLHWVWLFLKRRLESCLCSHSSSLLGGYFKFRYTLSLIIVCLVFFLCSCISCPEGNYVDREQHKCFPCPISESIINCVNCCVNLKRPLLKMYFVWIDIRQYNYYNGHKEHLVMRLAV